MTAWVCLRCDRESDRGGSCPNCGAPLYRADPATPAGVPQALPAMLSRSPEPPSVDPDRPEASPTEPRPADKRRAASIGVAAMAALLVVLGVTWSAARSAGPGPGQAPPPPPEGLERGSQGSLIYAATDDAGDGRLMVWDPAVGTVAIGTRIEGVIELVRVETSRYQGIGATRVSERGRRQAVVLTGGTGRFLSRPVVTGDLVAWGPDGVSVVAADRGREAGGCRENASIVEANLERLTAEREFRRRRLCGDLVALGRDRTRTFVSLASARGVATYFAGLDVLHREVEGSTLLSVAPTGELLLSPSDGAARSRLPPVAARAGEDTPVLPAAGGSLLYWSGRGGPVPIGTASEDLYVEQVLAWSPDGLRALVVGRLGTAHGAYLIEGGFGGSRRVPELLIPISGPVTGGAFGPNGEIALAMDGRLLVRRGTGGLAPQELPDDAPVPFGPILWLA